MNVIYVGTVPPNHIVEEIKGLGSYIDYATLTFQNALVAGLDYWYPNMRILSDIRVDEYPKVKKVIFKPEEYSHKDGGEKDDRFVRIVNIPLLKRIFLFIDKRREIKKMLREGEKNVIIMYSLPSSQLLAVASLRKQLYKSCLVIPDLPEFMSSKRDLIRRMAKSIDRKLIEWSIRRMDTFVLLSSHMAERLPLEGKKWKQMEGIYQPSAISINFKKTPTKTILYTGTLGERYGIGDLLKAFRLIDSPDYRLLIRGGGEMKDEVIRLSKVDSRIQYVEPLSKEDLLRLQMSSTVLVNPVRRSQDFTRYFFPSKTMEYLASGTPVVMYHLDCIPKDYDEYINYIAEETIESLRDKIVEVCESKSEESNARAAKAATFIKEKKNAVVQTKVIYDLINE